MFIYKVITAISTFLIGTTVTLELHLRCILSNTKNLLKTGSNIAWLKYKMCGVICIYIFHINYSGSPKKAVLTLFAHKSGP